MFLKMLLKLVLWTFLMGYGAKSQKLNILEQYPRPFGKLEGFGNSPVIQNQVTRRNLISGFDSGKTGLRSIHDLLRDMFSFGLTGPERMRPALGPSSIFSDIQPFFSQTQFPFSGVFPPLQLPISPREWWNGPNVCIERKEDDLLVVGGTSALNTSNNNSVMDDTFGGGSSMHINTCSYSMDNEAYTCVTEVQKPNFHRKYTVKYQCCYGFIRDSEDSFCTKVVTLVSLSTTLVKLKLTGLHQALLDSGQLVHLDAGNFTIFAPTNEAFEEFQTPANEISVVTNFPDVSTALLGHVVPGLIRASDLTDEQMLNTSANTAIRINLFASADNGLTANCARIMAINNYAENGVVHVVDRVIQPVTRTLEGALNEDGRFSTFIQLMTDVGLSDILRHPDGHVTILVPTNDAFRGIDVDLRTRLNNDKTCLKRVLQTHIFPHVICSTVIEKTALASNVLHKLMRFSRVFGRLTVHNKTISGADNLATNGVYHVIDDVIIPQEVKSLLRIASDAGLDAFVNLVKFVGMQPQLEGSRNITIFAPSNRAVAKMSNETLSGEDIRNIVQYHIVRPSISLVDFKNNLEIASTSKGQLLRMNVYEEFPFGKNVITLNCAKVSVVNMKACDGSSIYVVEKVLIPPSIDLIQTMESNGNFTQFLLALRTSGLDQTLASNGPYTIFVPSDAAFASLSAEISERLLTNSSFLKSLIQLHIFPRQICCAGVSEDSLFFSQYSRPMNPNFSLPLRRNRFGQVKIAGALVTTCDIVATNGILHYIDQVIVPRNFL